MGPGRFTLDWEALCDSQYENAADTPDEALAFYIQQPIKNAQHAQIKATKKTFLFQENRRELIPFSLESLRRDEMSTTTGGLCF